MQQLFLKVAISQLLAFSLKLLAMSELELERWKLSRPSTGGKTSVASILEKITPGIDEASKRSPEGRLFTICPGTR